MAETLSVESEGPQSLQPETVMVPQNQANDDRKSLFPKTGKTSNEVQIFLNTFFDCCLARSGIHSLPNQNIATRVRSRSVYL